MKKIILITSLFVISLASCQRENFTEELRGVRAVEPEKKSEPKVIPGKLAIKLAENIQLYSKDWSDLTPSENMFILLEDLGEEGKWRNSKCNLTIEFNIDRFTSHHKYLAMIKLVDATDTTYFEGDDIQYLAPIIEEFFIERHRRSENEKALKKEQERKNKEAEKQKRMLSKLCK